MKARKFKKRDRTTSGRATGTLICRLSLPTTSEEYDRRATTNNPARAIQLIRQFVERHLSKSPDLLTGAHFVIEAEVRASSHGLRRKQLAVWKFGDDITSTFEKASQAWASLELEEDYIAMETDITIP